jgi:hypothetical protein
MDSYSVGASVIIMKDPKHFRDGCSSYYQSLDNNNQYIRVDEGDNQNTSFILFCDKEYAIMNIASLIYNDGWKLVEATGPELVPANIYKEWSYAQHKLNEPDEWLGKL